MRCGGIVYGYSNSYGFSSSSGAQTDETLYTLNNATTLSNVTTSNNTGNLTVGGNLTSSFCLFSSSTSDSISVGGIWTSTGYVIFVSNGNIRIGTSFIGYDFYSHGSGNITVGQPGYTGEVFRASSFSYPWYSSYSYQAPFRSNTIRIFGTGIKTFNGSVNSVNSTSFSGGTVNINGNLNVQADNHYSSSYCDRMYRSLINAGCQFKVTGSVTAGTVASPAGNGSTGSWFCIDDAGTNVNIADNFTQAGLIVYNGQAGIGGRFTAKGYSTGDCSDISAYGLRVNDGLLTLANPQTITTTGNILNNTYAGRGFAALLYALPRTAYFKNGGAQGANLTPNNSNIYVHVDRTNTAQNVGYSGFNLIGNPYPEAIKASAFLNETDNSDVIWKHIWYHSHNPNDISIQQWDYYCIDDGYAAVVSPNRDSLTLDTIPVNHIPRRR